ncbi:MAG TPA: ATP-binding cassette domain-containing protein [Burkholderiaceae bacterium]|nr:ATP-binding cassette domain-containing protein [Burkholderiaceae bacterium]
MLEIEKLSVVLGSRRVLDEVSLRVSSGSLVSISGRNGSGRSTLLRAVAGAVQRTGRIALDHVELADLPAWRVAREGVGFAPDTRDVFARLTVDEHFALVPAVSAWTDRYALLDVLAPIARRRRVHAGALSGGEQKLLSIARSALVARRLWLLDEPFEGLAAPMIDAVAALIQQARAAEVTVIVADGAAPNTLSEASMRLSIEGGRLRS